MTTYRTPGVYIEEISKLPASIAPVATAVPAFIGYVKNCAAEDLFKPVRIESWLDYVRYFGGPYDQSFDVELADNADASDVVITVTKNGDVPYTLPYQVQMYFDNGGGAAWVIPVDTYVSSAWSIDDIKLGTGVDAAEEVDEVTLLLVPEAVGLDLAPSKTLHDKMLDQCNRLQDRFALFDAPDTGDAGVDASGMRARVGTSYLKYGAAYYPSFKSGIAYNYTDSSVAIDDDRATLVYDRPGTTLGDVAGLEDDGKADVVFTFADAKGTYTDKNIQVKDDGGAVLSTTKLDNATYTSKTWPVMLAAIAANVSAATAGVTVQVLSEPEQSIVFIHDAGGDVGNDFTVEILDTDDVTVLETLTFTGGGAAGSIANPALYRRIRAMLRDHTIDLYPCGAIAGVYARTDRDRGVWKAPANTDVRRISRLNTLVTNKDQGSLNIDPDTGKSINVIRDFAGRGTLVWGARTLAGNDNEWRYVPVRRFFNFVEESVKKATEAVVFEPNDANTWLKVKAMIENFLTLQWRQGALQGATTAEAFYVSVGLGKTMTQDDILNGIMNVEIGMAAVRPAEFIVLKFSHFIQNS